MFHGPAPGGGASRRCEDFRLCVTAPRPPLDVCLFTGPAIR